MKPTSPFGPVPLPGVLGAVLLVLLAGCALTPGSEPPTPEGQDVGYGTVDPDHSAGTAVTVAADDPNTGRQRSFYEMLARVPGVQVVTLANGALSVRIRGTSSFQGDTTPLFVLDGMTIPGISGINPADIESITVLKDPGETAIYGSRGANGVILLRSKRR